MKNYFNGQNINWAKVPVEHVTVEGWNEHIDYLNELKVTYKAPIGNRKTTTSIYKLGHTYFITRESHSVMLHAVFVDENEELIIERVCFASHDMKAENVNTTNGSYAFCSIDNKFRKQYKKKLSEAFSGTDYSAIYRKIKKCVPAPVNYYNRFFVDMKISNVYKADVSSAYPAQLSKTLPTLHDHMVLKGTHEPTAEYPFAFYVKSHHCSEYGGFDTRKLTQSPFYILSRTCADGGIRFPDVKPEDDETILCKASTYSLAAIMCEYYEGRKEHPEYKAIMNMGIGYFHKNSNPNLAHIAAVVLGRCAHDMISKAEELEEMGNLVLLINTDSVSWVGKPEHPVTDAEKKLGAFVMEYEAAEFIICGAKKYQIKTENEIKTIWAGVPKEKTQDMEFGEILTSQLTPDLYRLNNLSHKFEKVEDFKIG